MVVVAVILERDRRALMCATVPAFAYALAVLLRDVVLVRPCFLDCANPESTLPSGHTTAVIAGVLVTSALLGLRCF